MHELFPENAITNCRAASVNIRFLFPKFLIGIANSSQFYIDHFADNSELQLDKDVKCGAFRLLPAHTNSAT